MHILTSTLPKPVLGVSFAPDGKTLVAGGNGGVDVWTLSTGAHRHVPIKPSKTVWAFCHDPRGRWFYYSAYRLGLHIYDLGSGEFRRFPDHEYENHVTSLAAAPNATRVAISRGGAWVNRLECCAINRAGELRQQWTVKSTGEMFRGLSFSPDSRTLAVIEADEKKPLSFRITLRDPADGKIKGKMGSFPCFIREQTRFVPGGKRLIAWAEGWLTVWDLKAGKEVGSLTAAGRASFVDVAVHPSGRFFATVSSDGQTRYWDLDGPGQIASFKWKIGRQNAIAFSPDGRKAASGGMGGKIAVWEVAQDS